MPTNDEILAKVQELMVDALGVDDDEVTPEATLMGDLGAESIDFLDITFRLEKAFNTKIPRDELFPDPLSAADDGFVVDGKITPAGVAELKKRMPHADIDSLPPNPKREDIQDLITVQMVVNFLKAKLG